MFEEYLYDTSHYIGEARSLWSHNDDDGARRAYRVAAMIGVASLETFVNFISGTFETASAQTLQSYELAFLMDKRFGHSSGRFSIQNQSAYNRLEDKLRFLIARFSVGLDLGKSTEWSQFIDLKRLRDSLVHSRDEEDTTPIAYYDKACAEGLTASLMLMNELSTGIFNKPLRAKLTDLAQ